jgi:hypothetical protein
VKIGLSQSASHICLPLGSFSSCPRRSLQKYLDILENTIMYAGGYDTIDDDYGIQRKSNGVLVIIIDTRKQQSTTTNFSLLFVLSYITSMNEGLRLLICMVVMVVRETVMVEDCRETSISPFSVLSTFVKRGSGNFLITCENGDYLHSGASGSSE